MSDDAEYRGAARRCRVPHDRRRLTAPSWRTRSATSAVIATRPNAAFCSCCGSALDNLDDRTITSPRSTRCRKRPGRLTTWSSPVGRDARGAGVARRARRSAGRSNDSRSSASSPASGGTRTARSSSTTSPCRAATPTSGAAGDGYEVRDAGSLNGTYVNQERIERRRAAARRRVAGRQVPSRVLRARADA